MSAAAAASRTPCRAVLLAAQPSCLDAVPSQFNSNVAVYEFSDDISFPKELRNARALFLDQSGANADADHACNPATCIDGAGEQSASCHCITDNVHAA